MRLAQLPDAITTTDSQVDIGNKKNGEVKIVQGIDNLKDQFYLELNYKEPAKEARRHRFPVYKFSSFYE